MRRTVFGLGVMVLAILVPSLAVEKPYQTGRIVKVEQKTRTRVLYYLVNTPVTKDDPYYEVSIRFGNQICVGEYTPRHAADALPAEWKSGGEVQVRLEKHHMFVKGRGVDWDLVIVKRLQAAASNATDQTLLQK